MFEGNVFITGGAGYLGRGIIKRATDEQWPCKIIVFSRDEVKHARIKRQYPHVTCIRGDVGGSLDHLMAAMAGSDIVIHAAAAKIIPTAEENVLYTIQDNVIGSANVCSAALNTGVKKVVGISTDKVCAPVNVYGATKMLMERIFQESQFLGFPTDFHLVRYGNVLDSTASVLTVWYRQIQQEGYLEITDPNMTRFWLSVDMAVDLILLALKSPPSTVTIPLLPGLRMSDMAEYVYPGVEQKIIGVRPGEKKHEVLLTREEAYRAHYNKNEQAFLIWPSTSNIRVEKPEWRRYASDNPIVWLSKDELLEMAEIEG